MTTLQPNPAPPVSAALVPALVPAPEFPAAAGVPPSTFNSQPACPCLPRETPRAFGAFVAFLQLGSARSLAAVATKLGEPLGTVKNWSSKHDWSERLQAFQAGRFEAQARDQAARQRQYAADWANRLHHFREQEWLVAQKLIAAAQCFLETFGEAELHKMTLTQVARALQISSAIGRSALAGAELPVASDDPARSLLQQQLLAGVTRVYGPPAPAAPHGGSANSPVPPAASPANPPLALHPEPSPLN